MRRRIGMLCTAAAVAAGLLAIGTAPNAQAAVCVGQGFVTLDTQIGLPVVGEKSDVGFSVNVGCIGGFTSGSGTLSTASCGRSEGTGTTGAGEAFEVTTAGTLVLLSPGSGSDVVGIGNAVLNPFVSNNDCTRGTARSFVLALAVSGV